MASTFSEPSRTRRPRLREQANSASRFRAARPAALQVLRRPAREIAGSPPTAPRTNGSGSEHITASPTPRLVDPEEHHETVLQHLLRCPSGGICSARRRAARRACRPASRRAAATPRSAGAPAALIPASASADDHRLSAGRSTTRQVTTCSPPAPRATFPPAAPARPGAGPPAPPRSAVSPTDSIRHPRGRARRRKTECRRAARGVRPRHNSPSWDGTGYGRPWPSSGPRSPAGDRGGGLRHRLAGGALPPGDLEFVESLIAATEHLVVATGIVNMWASDAGEALAASYHRIEERPSRPAPAGRGHRAPGGHEGVRQPVPDDGRLPGRARRSRRPDRERLALAALGPKVLSPTWPRSAPASSIPTSCPPEYTREARAQLGPDALLAPEQKVVIETDPEKARAIGRPRVRHALPAPAQLHLEPARAGFHRRRPGRQRAATG